MKNKLVNAFYLVPIIGLCIVGLLACLAGWRWLDDQCGRLLMGRGLKAEGRRQK